MTYIPKHSLVAYHCLWFLWFLVSGLFHPTSQSPAVHLHAWQLSFMPRVVVVRMEAFGLRQGISWQLRCPLAGCIFVSTSSWRLTPQSLKTTVCLSSNLGLSLDCWLASELIYGSHQAQLPFTDDIVSTGLYTGWWSAVALKNSGQVLWDHRHQPVRARAQGA